MTLANSSYTHLYRIQLFDKDNKKESERVIRRNKHQIKQIKIYMASSWMALYNKWMNRNWKKKQIQFIKLVWLLLVDGWGWFTFCICVHYVLKPGFSLSLSLILLCLCLNVTYDQCHSTLFPILFVDNLTWPSSIIISEIYFKYGNLNKKSGTPYVCVSECRSWWLQFDKKKPDYWICRYYPSMTHTRIWFSSTNQLLLK